MMPSLTNELGLVHIFLAQQSIAGHSIDLEIQLVKHHHISGDIKATSDCFLHQLLTISLEARDSAPAN
jgi:hypothetical protein